MSDKPKPKILAVDDDYSTLRLLKIMLEKEFDVITFKGGVSALEWLNQGNKPDLITCDLNNPEMDGLDFIRQVRLREDTKSTPVITISSYFTQNYSSKYTESLEAGSNACLSKPPSKDTLIRTIRSLLQIAAKPNYPTTEL